MSRFDNVRQRHGSWIVHSRHQHKGERHQGESVMAEVVKRIAAAVATLTLAFGVIAGTELSAGADTTSPATPISVLPQSGVTTQLDSAAQAAQVSVDHRSTTTKKKKTSKGAKALAYAKKQLGDRYRYGGTGPSSWDCSGLTRAAWKKAGKKIPRTSQGQSRYGKKVKKSQLQKGDLVFFYSGKSHVGIYAGKGKVIHASRPGKPVAYIKIKYMPYAGARRPG
jgi:cell wall-associated NlpC family hydrolase